MKRDTTQRVNITLSKSILQKSQAYAAEKGVPFSALISELLKQEIEGNQEQPPRAAGITKDDVREALFEALKDPRTRARLKNQEPTTPAAAAPTEDPGNIAITPGTVTRMKRFTVTELKAASGLPHAVISKVRTGKQGLMRRKSYQKLMQGLEVLEGQGTV